MPEEAIHMSPEISISSLAYLKHKVNDYKGIVWDFYGSYMSDLGLAWAIEARHCRQCFAKRASRWFEVERISSGFPQ
jgi:hypothetical protein